MIGLDYLFLFIAIFGVGYEKAALPRMFTL